MTSEEMIAKFKNIILSEIYRLETKYDEEIEKEVFVDTKAFNELLQLNSFVVGAAKKQMPKKPVRENPEAAPRCPECTAIHYQLFRKIKIDYCARCGQAIDWSE